MIPKWYRYIANQIYRKHNFRAKIVPNPNKTMEVKEVLITSNRKIMAFLSCAYTRKVFNLESKHTRKKDLPLKCLFIIIFFTHLINLKQFFLNNSILYQTSFFFCLIPKNKGFLDIFNFKATKLSKIYRHPFARAPPPPPARACARARIRDLTNRENLPATCSRMRACAYHDKKFEIL